MIDTAVKSLNKYKKKLYQSCLDIYFDVRDIFSFVNQKQRRANSLAHDLSMAMFVDVDSPYSLTTAKF